jgi:hypothetical protein
MVLANFENEGQLSHPHLDRRYIVPEELKGGICVAQNASAFATI